MGTSTSSAATLGIPRLSISCSSSSFCNRNVRVLLSPLRCPSLLLLGAGKPTPLHSCPFVSFSSSFTFPPLPDPSCVSSAFPFKHHHAQFNPISSSHNDAAAGFQKEEAIAALEEKEEVADNLLKEQEKQEVLNTNTSTNIKPSLSVREKKELSSYAHRLGKKLKSQQVGKSGVTPSVAASFVETLESKELLKLKIHGSCPGELIDVIRQLEEATGSVAVDQIGRSVILYRPSLSNMKKREAASLRKPKEYPSYRTQKKVQAPRASGGGRHQTRSS